MRRIAFVVLLVVGGGISAQSPVTSPPATITPSVEAPLTSVMDGPMLSSGVLLGEESRRGLFQSDRAFPRFVGPITNPVLSKDPRSMTELRGLFVNNTFPTSNQVLQGGDAQVYGAQVRVALTDRLTFIADKDGYASLQPKGLPSQNGFLDIAAGMKYAFIRDVENQFLVTGGFMYEPPTGESKVFQHNGSGVFTVFGVAGKEFCENWHVLVNGGYQFGANNNYNSSFAYSQLHVDRQFFGWLSPLVEFNWYHYTSGGNHGLPAILGEGDGLINFGTSGMAGQDIVTGAVGLKAQINANLEIGAAYETGLGRRHILSDRVLVEVILRY